MTSGRKSTHNNTPEIISDRGKAALWISFGLIVLLLLIRFIAVLFPSVRIWGFNHFIFLPDSYTLLLAIASLVALMLPFISGSWRGNFNISSAFSGIFFDSPRKYIHRLIFVAVAGAMFTFFAAPTHFLGDGYTLIANLGSDSGTFYKWSEKWITVLLSQIQSLIGQKNEHTACAAFQTVSVFSGLISIWFYFLIAELITKDNMLRLLSFSTIMISSVILLFFGYVENYPLIWPPLCGFVYFGLRRTQNGRGIVTAGLFLLAGILVHLQMAVILPAYLFLIFCNGKGLTFYKRFKAGLWVLIAIGAAGFIILFVLKYKSDLYFQNIFLPLFKGKDIYPEYSLLGLRHLLDIANQLFLLSPLLPWLLYMSIGDFAKIKKAKDSLFLALIAVFSLAFLFIIDPKLAMPRDWDLFSFTTVGLNLSLITLIATRKIPVIKKTMPTLIMYLLIAVAPFLLVNLNRANSIKYFNYIVELDQKKSFPSLVTLKNYYLGLGQKKEADRIIKIIDRNFPNEKRMDQAFRALDNYNLELAGTLIKSIDPDKYSSNYHNLLSMFYLYTNNFEGALEESQMALQLRQYDPLLMCNHAMILSTMNRDVEAAAALTRAYRLDSTNMVILEGLATTYMKSARVDSVYKYAQKMTLKDSAYSASYFILAKTYAMTGDNEKALVSYQKFKAVGINSLNYDTNCGELENLIFRK